MTSPSARHTAQATDSDDGGLSLDKVTLNLGDGDTVLTVLDDVSLHVEPGEFVAVVGPSGAGKSSLLAVAGALTTPAIGRVLVAGTDIAPLSHRERARVRRDHIGFVFQSGNLIPALTSIDQLRFAQHVARRRAGDPEFPAALLTEVGLSSRRDHRPHQLSGGERQRVAIARALVNRPSVLLVDEPTAALDRARSGEIVELLARETAAHDVATLMVTHDTDVLDRCDRVVEMVDGKVS